MTSLLTTPYRARRGPTPPTHALVVPYSTHCTRYRVHTVVRVTMTRIPCTFFRRFLISAFCDRPRTHTRCDAPPALEQLPRAASDARRHAAATQRATVG